MSGPRNEPRRRYVTLDGITWKLMFFPLVVALIIAVVLLWVGPSSSIDATSSSMGGGAGTAPATGPASRPASSPASRPWKPPRFAARRADRNAMVRTIRRFYGLTDQSVLKAMSAVPRHEFVPPRLRGSAYADTPLPIGYGQTISQPYIVAEMTRRLQLKPTSRVLEIGTGSGYQAAVLSEFTRHVYTIEIIKPLADSASRRLKRLGYDVVRVRHGDGYYGWAEKGPFEAIIVTAAAGEIPPPLIRQLAPGGRMIIPVGPVFATQSLMLLTKDRAGKVRSRNIMSVRFVPLRRKDAAAK